MDDLKRALLEGSQHRERVVLEHPNGGQIDIYIRPLTSREAADVQQIANKGMQAPVDQSGRATVTVDLADFQHRRWMADLKLVSLALTHGEQEWTQDEVAELRSDWVTKIAGAARRISGMRSPDADTFRNDIGDGGPGGVNGAGDAGVGAVRDSADADTG